MAREPEILELVARLGAADAGARRAAGEALLARGAAARPALLTALSGGGPEARKAAAFLLGRSGAAAESAPALAAALADAEPKVRKNAAVALGRVGAEPEVPALAAALEHEDIAWVRPSLVLALGGLGGEAARAALATIEPRSAAEEEALAKARDRLASASRQGEGGKRPAVAWRGGSGLATPSATFAVCVRVPPGLEDVARAEAEERGLPAPAIAGAGLLRFPPGVPAEGLLARLRCALDVRLLLAEGPPPVRSPGARSSGARSSGGDLAAAATGLLASAAPLAGWRSWLDAGGEPLRYRFALDGLRLPKSAFRELLAALRRTLAPLGLADSPSGYAVQLVLEAGTGRTRWWLLPSFEPDLRFAYRRSDVGAAIHPVVAACLSRLVRTGPGPATGPGLVLDPTCGSGTLLIERALLSPDVVLRGGDVSPTAVAAAWQNVEAAGLAARISVERADAVDPASWQPVREVLANLPFGLRTRGQDRGLEELYRRLVEHLGRFLEPGGRAVLYTANARALAPALARAASALRVAGKRRVASGGLEVGVWVIEPTGSAA